MNRNGPKRLAFVMVATVIVVVVSERVYWYFARDVETQLVLLGFYAPALASVLWLTSRYRVTGLWGLLLVVPVFAYLVEGAIVPVLYSGGPLVPFFPAMFTFWHGVLSVVVVLFLFRTWLLAGRWRPLLLSSIGLGLFWGMWALTAVVETKEPDFVAEFGTEPQLLDTMQFAVYAVVCTAVLAVAHWLLGFVWMPSFQPTKRTRTIWLLIVASVVGGWTLAIPWAAPMFVVYAGAQIWALRRLPPPDGPTLLAKLDGRIPARNLWPLVAIPSAAAASHLLWQRADLSPETIEGWIFILGSTLQAAIGLAVLVLSHRWRFRASRAEARMLVNGSRLDVTVDSSNVVGMGDSRSGGGAVPTGIHRPAPD